MTNYREILRLNAQELSQREIAASCGCSKTTVSNIITKAKEKRITWPLPEAITDKALQKMLFESSNGTSTQATTYKLPDYEYVHKELGRSGVTLSLLWNEYCEKCRLSKEIPYMYTQFCKYYREFASHTKATMHIERKPGEQMEVDWAGQTAEIANSDTGGKIIAYIFVATLSSSGYSYVEAFQSQNQESWITAHVNAFNFFGGVTRILIPDNLKTGVISHTQHTPIINKIYNEMAEHYKTVVIPARVRKPKDKAKVEDTVGVISTWILAALRNQKFFSIGELNIAIKDKLAEFNAKPFQKKPGSRLIAFQEEKQYMIPLPQQPYELATWKVATVQYNYHIAIEKMYYSVPYEYIKKKVDVRITQNVIEVFYENTRICSHPRLQGYPGQYQTIEAHMPPSHKLYTAWNGERFISWSKNIGVHTEIVVQSILSFHKVEQQGYRACIALLKLADRYSVVRLENACKRALTYTANPSYKSVETILKTGQDKVDPPQSEENKETAENFGFVRGASYYGRDSK